MPEPLYSARDVAKLFGLQEARLRYWAQTGFVGPSARRRGRLYYTFRDLIGIRTAKTLLDSGLTLQRVRRNLEALRKALPDVDQPLARLKICSNGDRIVVLDRDVAYQPESGQVVMDFDVESLSSKLAEVVPLQADGNPGPEPTAYGWFLRGTEAELDERYDDAEAAYRRALQSDPHLAAAHTNLGNLLYARSATSEARQEYERALELDPEQPEARFNLANLLDDLGESELAIAELRWVANRCPEFADAHYNLGVLLLRVGATAQAERHLSRYLELDPDSEWAAAARALTRPTLTRAGRTS